jgi:hypothetical protein
MRICQKFLEESQVLEVGLNSIFHRSRHLVDKMGASELVDLVQYSFHRSVASLSQRICALFSLRKIYIWTNRFLSWLVANEICLQASFGSLNVKVETSYV